MRRATKHLEEECKTDKWSELPEGLTEAKKEEYLANYRKQCKLLEPPPSR